MDKTTRGKHIINSYLAGIIDGEGSIFISRINNKKSGNVWYRLQVSCAMTENSAINLLRKTFTPDTKQFIYRGGREKGYKPSYQWLVTGGTAKSILKQLLPYLLVKREQAQMGIKFQEWRERLKNTGKPRTKKEMKKFEHYYTKLKELKNVSSRND